MWGWRRDFYLLVQISAQDCSISLASYSPSYSCVVPSLLFWLHWFGLTFYLDVFSEISPKTTPMYCLHEGILHRHHITSHFSCLKLKCLSLFGLYFHCSSLKEVRIGTQTGLEPEGRNWCRGHGAVLLIGLLLMAWSGCFPIEHRTIRSGMAPPTMGWTLPINY